MSVVVGDEPAHDRVAHVERERRLDDGRRRELGRYEAEPAEIRDHRDERHAIDRPCGRSLYCRGRVESDTHILKRLYGFGEERLGRFAEELLSNPRVADAFSVALRRAFETKGRVDRNMQTVLALLNLPSRADLNRLLTKLEAIQGSLVNLNLKVDRLMATRTPRRRSTRKPAGGTRPTVAVLTTQASRRAAAPEPRGRGGARSHPGRRATPIGRQSGPRRRPVLPRIARAVRASPPGARRARAGPRSSARAARRAPATPVGRTGIRCRAAEVASGRARLTTIPSIASPIPASDRASVSVSRDEARLGAVTRSGAVAGLRKRSPTARRARACAGHVLDHADEVAHLAHEPDAGEALEAAQHGGEDHVREARAGGGQDGRRVLQDREGARVEEAREAAGASRKSTAWRAGGVSTTRSAALLGEAVDLLDGRIRPCPRASREVLVEPVLEHGPRLLRRAGERHDQLVERALHVEEGASRCAPRAERRERDAARARRQRPSPSASFSRCDGSTVSTAVRRPRRAASTARAAAVVVFPRRRCRRRG
jgi:hypothetical protein